MIINYIYNTNGQPEYAVVPYMIWEALEKKFDENTKRIANRIKNKFNPSDYRGILSHLNLDIELEIQNMRSEWTRDTL